MESTVAGGGTLKGLLDDLVVVELVLLDGLINADDILPDNTASTNVEMADFRVTHQALGKTNGQRRSIQLGEAGLALGELVHDRSLSSSNGIAILGRFGRRDTPTVNDDCTSAKQTLLANRPPNRAACNRKRECSRHCWVAGEGARRHCWETAVPGVAC